MFDKSKKVQTSWMLQRFRSTVNISNVHEGALTYVISVQHSLNYVGIY